MSALLPIATDRLHRENGRPDWGSFDRFGPYFIEPVIAGMLFKNLPSPGKKSN